MELMNSIQIMWTLIAFAVFVGILIWSFGSKRQQEFHEASILALDEVDIEKLEKKSGDKYHF